ncbi:hypothetical protein ABZU78_29335 [Rhodococcus erythropolis]|uniref:hypothetical protein n=1 Tax=Rhodococcus erythropolis TaxID=1833 RepID=UPI0033AE48A5
MAARTTETSVDLHTVVEDFINERPQFVSALKNCTGGDADYFRWTGAAEARRQLAESLGWTTPHEWGERTSPRKPEPGGPA